MLQLQLKKVWAEIKKQWFLVGMVLVIGLAAAYPQFGKKNGTIEAQITVSYVVVSFIFLVSGAKLKTTALTEAFFYWKLIVFVQFISFVITPALGYAGSKFLGWIKFDSALSAGIIVAFCCPTTISSNVVLTLAAKGNEAVTLTNSVVGNIIGVFLSPVLMIWLLGINETSGTQTVDYGSVFLKMTITVIVPLIVGQLIRILFPKYVAKFQKIVDLSIFNSCCLLVLIYSVFCDTFSTGTFGDVPLLSLFAMLFICLIFLLLFSAISLFGPRMAMFRFSKKDSISILFCGSQKTVALGIPLINVIFDGSDKIAILSIPLLIYHAEQLFLGALLVPWLLKWTRNELPSRLDPGETLGSDLELSSNLAGTSSEELNQKIVILESQN